MQPNTDVLDAEPVITKPPVVEGSVEQSHANPLLSPKRGDHKVNALWSGVIGSLIAAFCTSTVLVVTHAWVVPTVARHQGRIDRMHQAMFDAAQFAGLLYGYTWNAWYERQRVVGATNKPVEDLQEVGAKANSLSNQLPLFFDDRVAAEWQRVIDGYQAVVYPITHPRESPNLPTEQQMNERMNPLSRSAGELLTRMRRMIQEAEDRLW